MTRLELHPMSGSKRAGQLARLIDELYSDGRRLVVWVADEGRRQALDDFLWTYSKLAFVPHSVWSASMGEVEDPVVLVGEPANPNRAAVLIVGDEPPSGDWLTRFDEVHDLIPEGPDGESRAAAWKRWQQEITEGGPA